MRPEPLGPTLLAFELATEACSVALLHEGRVLSRHAVAPRRHAELALPWADALITEAGIAKSRIDAIAVGVGPGAFTGVRLAISLAQGVALGLDRPVLPVSTLAALAAPGIGRGPVLTVIDARMGELYLGEFEADDEGLPRPVVAEALVPLDQAAGLLSARWAQRGHSPDVAVGTGMAAAGGAWWQPLTGALRTVSPDALPDAASVARIALKAWRAGAAVAPERLEPTYLRDKVALTSAEQAASRAAKAG